MVLVFLLTATPGFASVTVDDEQQVSFFGDVRLRAEMDDQDRDAQVSIDRERSRVWARLGATYQPNDYWSGNIRLATNAGFFNSAHTTLGNTSGSADFGVDRGFIKYAPNQNFDLWRGKYSLNFWQQTEVFWDEDGAAEGMGLAYQTGPV